MVFTRFDDSDTSEERKDFIFFSDDSVANVSLDFANDQTPDAQDHGITWANLHGGDNAMESQAPSFNVVGTSGANQIADVVASQEPVKAYVVANDVTTAQALDRNIVESATL